MNSPFTAVTRPRTSSGVPSCTRVMRITTLTMSEAPSTASATSATANTFVDANTIADSPKPATAANIIFPALRSIGQRVSTSAMVSAPTAGAARNSPNPHGPAANTSRANTGRSAVTPPSSTANRSSEMTPKIAGLRRMKAKPAKKAFKVSGSRDGAMRSMRIIAVSSTAAANSATQTPYTTDGPAV